MQSENSAVNETRHRARTELVYDLPTRLFHWLFALLFLIAFAIGKNVDDDSAIYPLHMLAGLTLGALVVWRIIWGFIGSHHARFTAFALKPFELIEYMKQVVLFKFKKNTSDRWWIGHNPASSWVALLMLALGLGLSVTGFLMTASGSNKEDFEDFHEIMANTFILASIAHIAGVVWHHIRYRDWIALSMIDGKKAKPLSFSQRGRDTAKADNTSIANTNAPHRVTSSSSIPSTHPIAAAVMLLILGSFVLYLYWNYESSSRILTFLGKSLELGE